MNHIEGIDRDQIQILSLDQMVDRDSMARVIDAFVDMLDLSQFGFKYYSLNQEGRPPYHPSSMMKLYLYGYQNSIRSGRKLEKACKECQLRSACTSGQSFKSSLSPSLKKMVPAP